MNFILAASLITPDLGLAFWTIVIFLLLLFVLRKMAWGPIVTGLKNREMSIQDALDSAKKAHEEMGKLKTANEKLLQDARADRDQMLREAQEIKDKIISEAKNEAQKEGRKLIESAREEINKEKDRAFQQVKSQVANLAIEAAEIILKHQLEDKKKQEKLMEDYLKEAKLN